MRHTSNSSILLQWARLHNLHAHRPLCCSPCAAQTGNMQQMLYAVIAIEVLDSIRIFSVSRRARARVHLRFGQIALHHAT